MYGSWTLIFAWSILEFWLSSTVRLLRRGFFCKNLFKLRYFFSSILALMLIGPELRLVESCCWAVAYLAFCSFASSISSSWSLEKCTMRSWSRGSCITWLTVERWSASLFKSISKICSKIGSQVGGPSSVGLGAHENLDKLSNGYLTIFYTTSGICLPVNGCLREQSSYKTQPSIHASLL